jgi:signal transduction histidine kinase
MKPKCRSSIRSLLHVWILGFAFSALALSSLFLIKSADDEIDRHLLLAQDVTQLYSDDSISTEFGRGNLVYVEDSLSRLNQILRGDKARLRSQAGVIVASTDPSEIGSQPLKLEDHFKLLSVPVREYSSRETLGTLEVIINRDTLVAAALKKAIFPAVTLFFSLFISSLVVIQFLQRRLIRPIQQLLSKVETPTSAPASWPIEIYDLANRLHDALKQRDLAMIGQFSSGIMHDLKTSLHSLKTGVELANEAEPNSARRTKCLELLLKSASHHVPSMDSLVATTLDGNRAIQIKAVNADIHSTLSQAIEKHSEMVTRYGVDLDIGSSCPQGSVSHDPIQLERVFSNVLKNAIEATTEYGAAPEKRVSIHYREDSKAIILIVEDSGPGLQIDPDELLLSVRTTKAHGSGLGLWVSRKIIEAHQGSITPGRADFLSGAKFEISIPKSQEVSA